jgi:hypothetical protein
MLKRLLNEGYQGWVCYLDADAYIADLDFDLREYLSDKEKIALIIAPSNPDTPWWAVNAGVFIINMSHPMGQTIVREWSRRFDEITDERLHAAKRWSEIEDDQILLQQVLRDLPAAEACTLLQKGDSRLLNYGDGQFIRQVLRLVGDLEKRAAYIRTQVEKVLPDRTRLAPAAQQADENGRLEAFVRAIYRVLLLREPDPTGLANGIMHLQAGMEVEALMGSFLASKEFAAKQRQFIGAYMGRGVSSISLTALANKYGSDKGTRHGAPPHKYTYLYDLILDNYRHLKINFLELGLAVGGPEVGGPIDRQADSPSVQMWLEYFPRAQIYGFDISDFSHLKYPRFTFVRGDGGSQEDLARLARTASGFDIIVDDGSHASYHQQLAFRHLFPKLRRGGTYLIEDLHWQSPIYEGKQLSLPKTADFMIAYFEGGKYLPNDLLSRDFMREVKNSVISYAWFPAFSGVSSPAKIFVLRKME